MIYTTKIQTKDGTIYDLGKREHAPKHEHLIACPGCLVTNAWTEPISDPVGHGSEVNYEKIVGL